MCIFQRWNLDDQDLYKKFYAQLTLIQLKFQKLQDWIQRKPSDFFFISANRTIWIIYLDISFYLSFIQLYNIQHNIIKTYIGFRNILLCFVVVPAYRDKKLFCFQYTKTFKAHQFLSILLLNLSFVFVSFTFVYNSITLLLPLLARHTALKNYIWYYLTILLLRRTRRNRRWWNKRLIYGTFITPGLHFAKKITTSIV